MPCLTSEEVLRGGCLSIKKVVFVCVCLGGCVRFLNRSGTEEDYTELQQLLEEEWKSALEKKPADKKRVRR